MSVNIVSFFSETLVMNKLGTGLLSTIFLTLGLERLATRLDSVSSHPSIIDKDLNSRNLYPSVWPIQVVSPKLQSHKLFPSKWPIQVANQKQQSHKLFPTNWPIQVVSPKPQSDKLWPSQWPTQLVTINKSSETT